MEALSWFGAFLSFFLSHLNFPPFNFALRFKNYQHILILTSRSYLPNMSKVTEVK